MFMGRSKGAGRGHTFVPSANSGVPIPQQASSWCLPGGQAWRSRRACGIFLLVLLAGVVCLFETDLIPALLQRAPAGQGHPWQQRVRLRIFQSSRQPNREPTSLQEQLPLLIAPASPQLPANSSLSDTPAQGRLDSHLQGGGAGAAGQVLTIASGSHAQQVTAGTPRQQQQPGSSSSQQRQQRRREHRSAPNTGPEVDGSLGGQQAATDEQAAEAAASSIEVDALQQAASADANGTFTISLQSEPDWRTVWQPGVTPEAIEEATRKLEEITQRPLILDSPEQPWNRQPSRFELRRIDGYNRHNPSFQAVAGNDSVFVKFPCIPGHAELDEAQMCAKGNLPVATEAATQVTESIQNVSDYCGLGHIRTRSWTAPVHGTTPQGVEVDGQTGFFAEWAVGTNPENLTKEQKRRWANSVPLEWVWYAALHDFIMCEADRHQGNIVIPPPGSDAQPMLFIDNDHELSNRRALGPELLGATSAQCIPSSLFLPMNLESWRVFTYHLPLMKLDFRCATGPGQDIPLPSRVRTCLEEFATSSALDLQARFGLLLPNFAEGLRQRAQDLLELGFWEALVRAASNGEASFWQDPTRLPFDDPMFPHWRGSTWRPLQAPECDWSQPIPPDP